MLFPHTILTGLNATLESKVPKLVPVFNLDLHSPRTFPTAMKAPIYTRRGPEIVLRISFEWESFSQSASTSDTLCSVLLGYRTEWKRHCSYALKSH